jgi:hypothetical protein
MTLRAVCPVESHFLAQLRQLTQPLTAFDITPPLVFHEIAEFDPTVRASFCERDFSSIKQPNKVLARNVEQIRSLLSCQLLMNWDDCDCVSTHQTSYCPFKDVEERCWYWYLHAPGPGEKSLSQGLFK